MKKLTALILAVIMVISLMGCSGKSTSESKIASSAPASAPASSEKQAGGQEPVKGGTLIIATAADAASMQPTEIRSPTNLYYASAIFESLLGFDEAGTPQPYLAESITEDVEGLTYTIELKKGIKFHDGTELTADVCKWNIDHYKAEGILSSSFYSNLESVEVTGDYTVVLHLSQWDSTLPNALARECGYMISQAAYESDPEGFGEHPVGTGPFQFESWEHGVSMSFTKFSDYWQGEPYLDGLKFVIYANQLVSQAALQSGEVHIISPLDFNMTNDMESQGYPVYTMKVPQSCYTICINCVNDDPLGNVKVRQAMAYAMDGEAILPVLFGDYAEATNQYGVPGSTYYDDAIDIKFDLEKAKALMEEAGYPDGFSTTLTVVNSERSIQFCQIVIEQLAKIGIQVELNIVDGGAYMLAIDTWDSGMLLHTMSMYNGINSQLMGNFRQGLSGGALGSGSFLHPDDLNQVLEEACASDSKSAVALFQQSQHMLFEDYCMMRALAVTYQAYVTSPKLHDCGYAENTPYGSTFHKAWLEE
ncbi:MAG: ABC transporter substrate-binding protein [Lawsonibacter sp.]|jgi:ABC-type transport system substrate-binding protein|nr:ABC transporter substrate-binding protein [Lawsonibacter sp.]